MDYLDIVLGALGGATAAIAAIAFMSKTYINNVLEKNVEDYKARLKQKNDELVEELRSQKATDVEHTKSRLEEARSLGDARRDYEYDARKRLYREYEPLLFQFVESAANALYRIYSLARSSRSGALQANGSGWLEGYGYYLSSTLYHLLSPLAIFKLIQRRMTLIDLRLDPGILAHYEMAKWLYISYTDDFEFARIDPALEYDPNRTNWKKKRNENQSIYWRQGIPIGRLDSALETMIVVSGETTRIMSFGEFESAFYDAASPLARSFDPVADIFVGFHPLARPILWRILVAQAYILSPLTRRRYLRYAEDGKHNGPWTIHRFDEVEQLDWRQPGQEEMEALALTQPFRVAEDYLAKNLPDYVDFENIAFNLRR